MRRISSHPHTGVASARHRLRGRVVPEADVQRLRGAPALDLRPAERRLDQPDRVAQRLVQLLPEEPAHRREGAHVVCGKGHVNRNTCARLVRDNGWCMGHLSQANHEISHFTL